MKIHICSSQFVTNSIEDLRVRVVYFLHFISSVKFLLSVLWYLLGPFQYPIRRLIVRSREVSKPREWYLALSDRSEIWWAPRQPCCRRACQISKRYDNLNYLSRGFATSRDFTIRHLIVYWKCALGLIPPRVNKRINTNIVKYIQV